LNSFHWNDAWVIAALLRAMLRCRLKSRQIDAKLQYRVGARKIENPQPSRSFKRQRTLTQQDDVVALNRLP
jgi:hypothetical protein